MRSSPRSTLFPYTTLFRSVRMRTLGSFTLRSFPLGSFAMCSSEMSFLWQVRKSNRVGCDGQRPARLPRVWPDTYGPADTLLIAATPCRSTQAHWPAECPPTRTKEKKGRQEETHVVLQVRVLGCRIRSSCWRRCQRDL